MDRNAAVAEIRRVFAMYKRVRPADVNLLTALKDGKLYELYVLSHLVDNLANRGFRLTFRGTSLRFKASPGRLISTDPHFEVASPGSASADFWIFVDIEFETLGCRHVTVGDHSRRHEIDIVVVSTTSAYPDHSDIALGVECKSTANFTKGIVKEVLGVRRELSLLDRSKPSLLTLAGSSVPVYVPADPPSEYWLAFVDGTGLNYCDSPSAFGIDFRHIEP